MCDYYSNSDKHTDNKECIYRKQRAVIEIDYNGHERTLSKIKYEQYK